MFLKYEHLAWIFVLFALSRVGGCGPDLGTPDYSSEVGLQDPIDPFPPVPPDPFQPGDERLSVGYFYEGGRSQTILINTVTTDYFVFAIDANDPVATRSFAEAASDDRAEGLLSYEVTLNGSPYWAGGIIWFQPIDLSDWTTMFVSFKSSDPSFAAFDLTLQSGEGDAPASVNLDPGTYGYTNDGEWHFLRIPLQDAIDRGWDPSTVRSPFIFSRAGGDPGDVLLIDNLYFTKD
ncbi:MAG: hypothetical protein WCF10_13920 [Polyangiales bacterium]